MKPRTNKSRKHADAGNQAPVVWYKLYPAQWAGLAMREPDNAKLGERVRRIVLALCERQRGSDAFADAVIQTTAEAMQRYSEAGRKAARARWADKTPCDRNAIGMRSHKIRKRQDRDKIETRKKEEREPEAAGAAALSHFSLESFKAIGAEEGYPPERVQKCFQHYRRSGWKDRQGQPVRNVRAVLSSWMNRPELSNPAEAAPSFSPEESRRAEAAQRRARTIREAAERCWAMGDWIKSGEVCPWEPDPPGAIDRARAKVESLYGAGALDELERAIDEVKREKSRAAR